MAGTIGAKADRALRWEHGYNPRNNSTAASASHSACKSCRDKKLKCNGKRPSCTRCEQHGVECTYPGRGRRTRRDITAQISEGQELDFSGAPPSDEVPPPSVVYEAQDDFNIARSASFASGSVDMVSSSQTSDAVSMDIDPFLPEMSSLHDLFPLGDLAQLGHGEKCAPDGSIATVNVNDEPRPYNPLLFASKNLTIPEAHMTNHYTDTRDPLIMLASSRRDSTQTIARDRSLPRCNYLANSSEAAEGFVNLEAQGDSVGVDTYLTWQRCAMQVCVTALSCARCASNPSALTPHLMLCEQLHSCLRRISEKPVEAVSCFEIYSSAGEQGAGQASTQTDKQRGQPEPSRPARQRSSFGDRPGLVGQGQLGGFCLETSEEWQCCVGILAVLHLRKLREIIRGLREKVEQEGGNMQAVMAALLEERIVELANSTRLTSG